MEKNNQPKAYYDVKQSGARIVACQGGTRSGKTYSILQVIIEFCWEHRNHGFRIEIARKTHTALVDTAMADFFEILINEGYYRESLHNKARGTYRMFGNTIKFSGIDQAQKKRGAKRHILFINEANDLTWDEFFQMNVRTKFKTIIDYNPSMEEDHWIYTKILSRPDCDFFQTTYKDNPFLTKTEIHEIEMLQQTDPYYWSIFGLGERAKNPAQIFTFEEIPDIPDGATLVGYGMDFGFTNSATALVAIWTRRVNDSTGKLTYNELIVDELIHGTQMTNQDIAAKLTEIGHPPHQTIWCDHAEPKSIEEIRRMGFRVNGAKKPPDAFDFFVNYVRQHKLRVTERSLNAKKELRMYKFAQDRNGKILNEPVKLHDHIADAMKYCLVMKAYKGKYVIA